MDDQLDLFGRGLALPEGFKFERELITREAETDLLGAIRALPFQEFEFHGYVGKRRTISFGWKYDFDRGALQPAEAMPGFLVGLRRAAADLAGRREEEFEQVLVTEYGAHAGIGWHRDKAVFGEIVGISLLSTCRFRLRRRVAEKWERVSISVAPRSGYYLSGPARSEWEHSIPEVDAARYSITFRTLRAQQ
jgi:alkylated DNA repair dioxygenase AlkB